jgi:RHS repeat-associated protein
LKRVTSTASTGTNNDNRAKYTTIAYTSFNLPDSSQGVVGANGAQYTWQYDDRHARVRETKVSAAGTRTTWSLHPDKAGGLGFEQEFAENGTVTNRNFLTAGGAVIGVLITQGDTWVNNAQVNRTTVVRTEYWHKDHLGSTAAVTDAAGAVTARYAFDPWGKRRFTNGTYDAFGTLVIEFSAGNTDRGFTGHEHLDDVGIVHMNGRLYDTHTGRFLQPDPYVQDVLLLQNFNRYGYVLNNPLNATDPSGEFIPQLLFVAAAFIVAKHVPELRPFMAIAVAFVLSPAGGFWALGNPFAQSALAGFAAGAVSTGNLRGAIQGAVSGALFAGIGEGLGSVSWSDPAAMANAIGAHAAAGCAMQAVSGGDCGSGALSAAFSKAVSPELPGANAPTEEKVFGVITSAVIGGTAAELGGGKFANGASTAAFGYLFNALTGDSRALFGEKGYGANGAAFHGGCVSPTVECAERWERANAVRLSGLGAIESVHPDALLLTAPLWPTRVAAFLFGPVRTGAPAFATGAGIGVGMELGFNIATGRDLDISRVASAGLVGGLSGVTFNSLLVAAGAAGGSSTWLARLAWQPNAAATTFSVNRAIDFYWRQRD